MPVGADLARLDAQARVLERRVAQPEPEREERLAGEVEVVVAAAGRLVVVDERQLPLGHRERDRQPAGRVGVAEEDVRHGVAALLARIPGVDDRADAVEPPRHRDGAAADQDDDDRLAGRGDGLDQLLLAAGQREERAVAELPFLDAGDDDGDVALAGERDRGRDRLVAVTVARRARVPDQLDARVAGALEVLEPQVVRGAGPERDRREAAAVRLLLPVVDHERAVEVEAVAVVPLDAERADAFRRDRQSSRSSAPSTSRTGCRGRAN